MSAFGGKADIGRPDLIGFEKLASCLTSLRRVTCAGEISSK
jgi:hypothetical protein